MPLDLFWHGDIRLLDAYRKAYLRDKSYTAWLNGAYNFEGQSKASANANRTKKSDPVLQYADWKDPIEQRSKATITKENREKEFRNLQAQQNLWLRNMMNK